MEQKQYPRITIITTEEFRKKVHLKALRQDKTLTIVLTELLEKWLKEK